MHIDICSWKMLANELIRIWIGSTLLKHCQVETSPKVHYLSLMNCQNMLYTMEC